MSCQNLVILAKHPVFSLPFFWNKQFWLKLSENSNHLEANTGRTKFYPDLVVVT